MTDAPPTPPTPDPLDLLRSPQYVVLLVFAALIGVPVAVAAFGFLGAVDGVQEWLFTSLPTDLGFDGAPAWWPLPILILAGVVVAVTVERLPGTAGHEPTGGISATGAPTPAELPGVVVAAFATLAFGAVLGPEAPLIAIGSGLAALAVHVAKKDAPAQAVTVIGAAGAFAAVSTLLGSPLLGAFLLMEVAGLAGPMIGVVLVPGLLAAGIGALVFVGLDDLTGWGTFSLAVPDIPPFTDLQGEHFLWAIAIGVLGAALGIAVLHSARALAPAVARHRMVLTPALGAMVALAAIAFDQATDRGTDQVLFSGESALAPLIQNASSWTVGALALLVVCKSLAFVASLSAFRGGPTFPAMMIGAAGGVALSHLPGLPMIAGVAMAIGSMAVTILRLPLTSVLLTSLFMAADQLTLMPLIIVSVVVAYVASARFAPRPADDAGAAAAGSAAP